MTIPLRTDVQLYAQLGFFGVFRTGSGFVHMHILICDFYIMVSNNSYKWYSEVLKIQSVFVEVTVMT